MRRLGTVLSQNINGHEQVDCYLSRSLTPQNRKYSTTERECLCVLWAIERLRCYIENTKFYVITDHHNLIWLSNLKDPRGRLGRWVLRLQQFNFKIIHRKGKNNVVPDCLSRSVPVINSISHQTGDKWYDKMRSRIIEDPLKFRKWRVTNDSVYKYVEPSLKNVTKDETK